MNERTLLPHVKLRFNIDHPSLEECYHFGYDCAAAEVSEDENPYHKGTEEHSQWLEGWWTGFYGEEPLFNQEEKEIFDEAAANEQSYNSDYSSYLFTFLKITGAIAATAIFGYQVFDMVA